MGLFACPFFFFFLCVLEIAWSCNTDMSFGQNHPGLSVRALVPRKAVFVLGFLDFTVCWKWQISFAGSFSCIF